MQLGIEPTTLCCQDNAPPNRATWHGLTVTLIASTIDPILVAQEMGWAERKSKRNGLSWKKVKKKWAEMKKIKKKWAELIDISLGGQVHRTQTPTTGTESRKRGREPQESLGVAAGESEFTQLCWSSPSPVLPCCKSILQPAAREGPPKTTHLSLL